MNIYHEEQKAREAGQQAEAARRAEVKRTATEAARNESRQTVIRLFDRIHVHDKLIVRAEGRRDEALDRLKRTIQAMPGLDNGDPMKTMARLSVVLLGIIGAYALDLLLFSSLVSYLLQMVGVDPASAFADGARLAVPAVIVGVEVVIATLLYSAKQKAYNRFRGAALGWTILAVAMAVGMSTLTAATFVANQGAESPFDLTLADLMLIIPITVFSAIPHSIVLFSGRYGPEGKAYLFLLWRRFRVRWLNRHFDKRGAKVLRAYHEFERAYHEHFQTYRERVWPGTFSETARRIINKLLGAEVIPPPESTPHSGDGSIRRPPAPLLSDAVSPERENGESR